jgi:hypothetical protein
MARPKQKTATADAAAPTTTPTDIIITNYADAVAKGKSIVAGIDDA